MTKTKSYIFNDKIKLLKQLNKKIIRENKSLDATEISKYDQIFQGTLNENYTMGDNIIFILWDIEKECMLKGKFKDIEKINGNFAEVLHTVIISINEIMLKNEIEEFINYASINREYFEGGNGEKVNRYKKNN